MNLAEIRTAWAIMPMKWMDIFILNGTKGSEEIGEEDVSEMAIFTHSSTLYARDVADVTSWGYNSFRRKYSDSHYKCSTHVLFTVFSEQDHKTRVQKDKQHIRWFRGWDSFAKCKCLADCQNMIYLSFSLNLMSAIWHLFCSVGDRQLNNVQSSP